MVCIAKNFGLMQLYRKLNLRLSNSSLYMYVPVMNPCTIYYCHLSVSYATVLGDTVSFPEFANDSISNCSLRNAIISDQVCVHMTCSVVMGKVFVGGVSF